MEIGNQIKALRTRRGITQEAMAEHFGISPQAVSKWERGAASPDIALLPQLSSYFGVTIDELFALSDDTRMERIQNMLWDVRYLNPADVENERQFLLNKAAREPENGRPHELLADMENHLAREHRAKAAEYAKEALQRDPTLVNAHGELEDGLNGRNRDWAYNNHNQIIEWYKEFLCAHPDNKSAYLTLLDQLLDDFRLTEASEYLESFAKHYDTYHIPLYRGLILWYAGDRDGAFAVWAQMERDYSDNWCVYQNIGDFLVRSERYEEAIAYYRRAFTLLPPPRWCDPIESIAQVYELMGNIPAAIAAWNEELDLLEQEWNTITGETADIVRRQIARLEKRLMR